MRQQIKLFWTWMYQLFVSGHAEAIKYFAQNVRLDSDTCRHLLNIYRHIDIDAFIALYDVCEQTFDEFDDIIGRDLASVRK
jgi:hypothetical protein